MTGLRDKVLNSYINWVLRTDTVCDRTYMKMGA